LRFDHYPVTTIEALRRKKEGAEVVRRDFGERSALICTLRAGDVLEASKDGRSAQLWLVRTVKSSGQMVLHLLADARAKSEIENDEATGLWYLNVNTGFSAGARKVAVSHLGEVLVSRD
jgi:hypothetical protein